MFVAAASKKQRRVAEFKSRKKKKGSRYLILSAVVLVAAGGLVFFFVTLFDYLFPPLSQREGTTRQEKESVVVYFSDSNERFLVPETRHVPKGKTPEDRAKEMVKALLDGSKTGLVNTFPDRTDLRFVKIEGDTAVVSFGKGLVRNHPGGSASEVATVYSLANTLTENLPGIARVRVLVDDKPQETIKGHIDLRQPIPANRELIAQTARERQG